ncbi:MAG TPA: hypothetical protein PKD00_02390 [Burkholderiales bacterium]|nr:hypothetical protein [Burkholderiales bacterium]
MKKSLTILLILFFNLIFANNFNMENFLPYKNEYKKITDDAFFKANSLHQNICQKNNSIDITDFADIKITSAVSDVVVCFSSPNINSLNISSAGSVQNVELNTHAPNGRVSSAPYLIKGTVAYVNGSIGSELSMAV